MAILVTGGAGFIGSHTCLELLEAGCQVVVVDNLSNSKQESLNRVRQITHGTVEEPTLMIATHRLDSVLLQQRYTGIDGSGAVQDIPGAQLDRHALGFEGFEGFTQKVAFCVNITDHSYTHHLTYAD